MLYVENNNFDCLNKSIKTTQNMAGGIGGSYSKKVGFIYIFNIVIGAGALTLPFAFKQAGLIAGTLVLAFMGLIAFVCVTFVIEAMSASNALLKKTESELAKEEVEDSAINVPVYLHSLRNSDNTVIQEITPKRFQEITPLVGSKMQSTQLEDVEYEMNPYAITIRTELGLMAEQFLGPVGKALFYIVVIFYLFGDTAIFAVVVPKTVMKASGNFYGLSEGLTHALYVAIFGLVVVPFSFFNFQKTKYLQIFTLITRNVALLSMILLSIIHIVEISSSGKKIFDNIKWFDGKGLAVLFGSSIYAFMCHHSLPAIVSPIKSKKGLSLLFFGDFGFIFITYTVLCWVALFAFNDAKLDTCPNRITPGPACQIQDMFHLNFTTYKFQPLAAFISLFPVFTLTTNYPLIAITLRNNLQTLLKPWKAFDEFKYSGIAGTGVQFIFPALLVIFSRRKLQNQKSSEVVHRSPFGHNIWAYAVLLFGVGCAIFNLVMMILDLTSGNKKKGSSGH
ncbi:hypothetical protein AKO1_012338 [Acrasis kona]|uniref:Amino acid transporter transmembrane domain-containing protein n=1 Tax=Acrasis kona TaxID=1008807 RepID=A0AAW2YWM1_9EUKA